jgi:hypothetical protein
MPTVQKQNPPKQVTQQAIPTPSSNGFFDQAVNIDKLQETGHKVLIFGDSGTGKTTLACSFPKPLLMVRPDKAEDGSRSVRTTQGISVLPKLTDPDQLAEVCDGQKATKRYKSIVLDGVSNFQDLIVKKHMGYQDVPVQQTYGMVPETDWNFIGIALKQYLRDLLDLTESCGTHIVIVGPERVFGIKTKRRDGSDMEEFDSSIVNPKVKVALTPSTTDWLHRACLYNIHTFKRLKTDEEGKLTNKVEFCLHVGNYSTTYGTKFQVPHGERLPADGIMVNELGKTFDRLDKLIRGV